MRWSSLAIPRRTLADTRPVGSAVPLAVPGHDLPRRCARHDRSLTDPLRIIRRLPAFTLAHLAQKPHRITPGHLTIPIELPRRRHAASSNRVYPHLNPRWCSRRSS